MKDDTTMDGSLPEEATVESTSIEQVRAQLRKATGPRYWRSLEELASTERFQNLLEREFPSLLPIDGLSKAPVERRRFLQLMGASLALAGLNGCTIQPDERIVPYVKQPEQLIPGKPLYFASAHALVGGYARGILVESHMGRPTKIEGNPDHPASGGTSDLFTQASILDLYDPDRAQTPQNLTRIRSWGAFGDEMEAQLAAQQPLGGSGIRFLTESTTSPTLARQMREFLARFPQARWDRYDGAHRNGLREGTRAAFGRRAEFYFDLSRADVVLTLDSDFLTQGPAALVYARAFADRRRVVDDGTSMNRMYCVESSPTATSTTADHRMNLKPQQVDAFALHVARALGVPGPAPSVDLPEAAIKLADEVAHDLTQARGRCVVTCGDQTSADLQVLVHAMNEQLGNLGTTVQLIDPVEVDPQDQAASLTLLVEEMRRGDVDLLIMLGGNPVFTAPGELRFRQAMEKVETRVHLSQSFDETSEYCQWHLPESHYLESWSDVRAFDGTTSITQPLISPLYDTHNVHEFMELIAGDPQPDGHDIVRATWQATTDRDWRRSLHDGVVADTKSAAIAATVSPAAVTQAATNLSRVRSGLTLELRPDTTVYDGRFANNGWLQECPKPLTKLTWDNAALMSPRTAEALGVENFDNVSIKRGTTEVTLPAWILPGHGEDSITLNVGYGRTKTGSVGKGAGFNVNPLATADLSWRIHDVQVTAAGGSHPLACTQDHHSMEGRDIIRSGSLDAYQKNPLHFAHHGHHVDINASLNPGFAYDGLKWGLTIDLTACNGCNACVMACQSENNIPVVGKDQVMRGRELHWIRIDRYFEGDLDQPDMVQQPVICMHCEQAPCEIVCPVSATVHSDEGLNDMVYNRCVGTRYCSNNCPYKVRRFNYYQYADNNTETLKMQRNPDVTVRHRGVMEKCSYCVQRINHARIEAKKDDLPLGDGTVTTACQQACPSQAIAFGDLNDPQAKVAKWQASPLNYGLLEELGTRPRTTYLTRVKNENANLTAGGDHGQEAH